MTCTSLSVTPCTVRHTCYRILLRFSWVRRTCTSTPLRGRPDTTRSPLNRYRSGCFDVTMDIKQNIYIIGKREFSIPVKYSWTKRKHDYTHTHTRETDHRTTLNTSDTCFKIAFISMYINSYHSHIGSSHFYYITCCWDVFIYLKFTSSSCIHV